jgi:hypothetical protein
VKTFTLTKQYIIVSLLPLGIVTLVAAIGLAWMVIGSRISQAPDKRLALAFIFVILFMWFLTLRPPYRLTIRDDHCVEFKSLLRTVVIASHEIKSIKAQILQPGMAELKHEKGRIQLALQFDGFYEFLGTLKKLNPDIEIRGC